MTSTPEPDGAPAREVADERLLAAHDLALAALHEITPATTVGAPAGHRVEDDGVVSLLFENAMSGYPGWFWTVSLARVEDSEPTVLEVELLPGEEALLAPEWVPWAVRLADYQAQQALLAGEAQAIEGEVDDDLDDDLDDDDAQGDDLDDEDDGLDDEDDDLDEDTDSDDDDDLDDEDDDLEDLDDGDFEPAGSRILHSGDVDGVDIDELDDDADDDTDEDDADDDDTDDDDDINEFEAETGDDPR